MRKPLAYLIGLLLLVFHACKPTPPEPYLRVNPSSLSFTEDGGSQTVQLSANYPWSARVSGTGLSVSPSSGEGDATITVKANPAASTDDISGSIVFYSEGKSANVEVRQTARSAILIGNVGRILAEGGTYEVEIQYNTDFTVEVESSARSWITFVQTKALSSGHLVFVFGANPGADPRTGKVTVRDRNGKADPVTLTFIQDEKKVIELGKVTEIAAEGGYYEVDIRYNTDYTVEVEPAAQSWITFVQTKALSSGRLVFVFEANAGTDPRSGKVSVTDPSGKAEPVTLTFVQAEKKVIEVGKVTEIEAEGGVYEVEIQYNTDFTVEVENAAKSWISFVQTKALTSGHLVFVFEENTGTDPRTGKVTVKDKTGKVPPITLTFVQAEKKTIEVGQVPEIAAEGGTYEVDIQYNTDFDIEIDPSAQSWITFVKTKALTSGCLVFVFEENTGTDPRTGKVTVKDKTGKVQPITLTFVQAEKKVLKVGEVTEIAAEGGTYEVEIQYNTDFSVEVDPAAYWIRFVGTKSLTSGHLVFSFDTNESPDPRTGKVTVKDKSGKLAPVTLTFVQAEKKVIKVGEVTEIAAEGGTYEVEIQYNTDFSIEVEPAAQSWVRFVQTKALTSGHLVFVFEENTEADPRSARVVVKDKEGMVDSVTLTFVQAEKKVIEVGEVTEIDAEGGIYEVGIQYNTDITVEVETSARSWITFVQTKALTSGDLVFAFEENTGTDPRTGKVTVRDKNGKAAPVTLTFVQAEKKVLEVGEVTEIAAEGGTYEVEIQYNTDYTVEVESAAQPWIKFVQTKALSSGRLVFVFEENTGTDPRTGKVTVKDKSGKAAPVTLTFVQAEKKVIKVGEVTEIEAEGGTYEVEIQYNTDFTVEVESAAKSWITFVQTKALTSGRLVFVFEENTGTDPRTGKVTVKDKNGKVAPLTLTFVQQEKKVIEVGEVTEIAAEGGTYEVDIRYNTDYTVEVESAVQSWIKFVQTKALTDGRLVFVFEANDSAASRSGKVTVKDKGGKTDPVTLTFVQGGAEPYFRLDGPEEIQLNYEAGEFTVYFDHNVPFNMERYSVGSLDGFDQYLDVKITYEKVSSLRTRMIFSYGLNNTREVRAVKFSFSDDSGAFSANLTIYQQPAEIVTSGLETILPSASSEFSFRVAGDNPEKYRIEVDADWIQSVGCQATPGGATFTMTAAGNPGALVRQAQIKVYLEGVGEPDVILVSQEGSGSLWFSVTYSGRQVKSPYLFGPYAERGIIWWGDGNSSPYSGGASHAYEASGNHTIKVTTGLMSYIERAEVTEMEDGMTIDFSGMRSSDE